MDSRSHRPIGVFDSGVGGLTVLDECLARLPAEDFVYFGDTAWFPYGDKDAHELRGRSEAIARWLLAQDAKMVVVACNTATAAALAHLQTHLDVPVIGVMTAESHAAVQASRSRRIGLLATEATVASGSYQRMIGAHDAGAEVTAVACPGLAAAIQRDNPFDDELADMVRGYTEPLREARVDTVILGCTHYPMVERLIRRNVPADAVLISSGEEIAREIADTLRRQGMLRDAGEGTYRFACSGDPAAFRTIGSRFLQMPFGEVQQVDPGAAAGA